MELDARPSEAEDPSYRVGLIALAILIFIVVALQFWSERSVHKSFNDGVNREASIRAGDFASKWAFAWSSHTKSTLALQYYEKALPWSVAYRRLGILKESSGKSGLAEFAKLDSPATTRHLDKKLIHKLHLEKQMWLHIYSTTRLSSKEAIRYTREIDKLDIGPLKDTALAEVQRRAGQPKKAARMLASARSNAQLLLIAGICLFGLLFIGGMGGVAIAIVFLVVWAPSLSTAPRFQLKSSALLTSFMIYLAAYMWLGAAVKILSKLVGFESADTWSGAWYMGMLIALAGGAFVIGICALIDRVGQDWRDIGFRTSGWARDILLGLAGFLSSIPFVMIAAVISYGLSNTLFKHFPTPEQPFGGIISEGGVIATILVFLAASVVAPIVEETFFRGALYTAFRGKMGVWRSVLLTSAIFAVIHPLPGGFLPIFAIACVLALLREKSGSLLPGIICHSVYNTVGLLLITLFS